MTKFIPWRDRCAMECGARKAPGKEICWNCYRRSAGRSAPGRDVAPSVERGGERPLPRERKPEAAPSSEPDKRLFDLHLTPDQEDELRRAMLKYPAGEVLRKLPGYEPPEPTDMDEIGGIGL